MIYAIYNTNTGEIRQSISMPEFMKDIIDLNKEEALVEIPRMAHDATEYIKDGKLASKNLPTAVPIEDLQASVWSNIKDKRSLELSKSILLESVDKVFQTDSNSITEYNNIASMIALDNYSPIEWKTEDNTFILLTVELFKELQKAISNNTQRIFKIAEDHKEAMLALADPLEYDYLTNW